MRLTIAAVLVLLVGNLAGSAASEAQVCTEDVTTGRLGEQTFVNACPRGSGAGPASPAEDAAGSSGSSASAGPPMLYKPYVDGDGPGGACITGDPQRQPGPLPDGSPSPELALRESAYASVFEGYLNEGYAPCAGSALPVVTPRLWVESWYRSQVFPVPDPRIGAGRFVVGLEAFLETGATLSVARSDASPFGPATLSLRSDVVVDWGDGSGEDEGPFNSVGGPYPDGDIRHVFQRSGFYDVVVTQRWTLEWSVGGAGGTITGVETSETLEEFEVFSVEAVISDTPPRGPSATIPPAPGE